MRDTSRSRGTEAGDADGQLKMACKKMRGDISCRSCKWLAERTPPGWLRNHYEATDLGARSDLYGTRSPRARAALLCYVRPLPRRTRQPGSRGELDVRHSARWRKLQRLLDGVGIRSHGMVDDGILSGWANDTGRQHHLYRLSLGEPLPAAAPRALDQSDPVRGIRERERRGQDHEGSGRS